jgi:hypothetical protein
VNGLAASDKAEELEQDCHRRTAYALYGETLQEYWRSGLRPKNAFDEKRRRLTEKAALFSSFLHLVLVYTALCEKLQRRHHQHSTSQPLDSPFVPFIRQAYERIEHFVKLMSESSISLTASLIATTRWLER